MKFLKKLFGNSNSENNPEPKKEESNNNSGKIVEIYSPLYGKIIDISEIPDEAFSGGMLGDGIGIEPNDDGDTIYSPCDTNEIGIFETKHAISMETKEGLELIVHFGIDTVQLNGKGFEALVKSDTEAKKSDPIVKYDLTFIKSHAKSIRTPVLINNMEIVKSIEKMSGEVKPGDIIMKVTLK